MHWYKALLTDVHTYRTYKEMLPRVKHHTRVFFRVRSKALFLCNRDLSLYLY